MKKLFFTFLFLCSILSMGHMQAQSNTLQERYDWLIAFADPDDCTTEKVEEYESFVGYKYLLITFTDGSQQLHNAEGTFYCKNGENYDCVTAYRLNGPTATWICSNPQTAEDNLIRRLQNSGTNCYSIVSISKFEYEGNNYYLPNAGNTLGYLLSNGPSPCGVLESFPSLFDAQGRRVCDFGFTALPCPITRTNETLVWTNEDATCTVEDPFSVGVVQRSANEDRFILQGNDTCKYVTDIIQFDYNGFTFFRINEAVYNSSCESTVASRFYSCTGDFVGGVGNTPTCQNTAVCQSLDLNSNNHGVVIWSFEDSQEQVACVTQGQIFFEDCDDGQEFFFVRTSDGRVYDPYLGTGITYEPINGQAIKFDFEEADFSSPCSLAEKAIILTCVSVVETDCTIQDPLTLPNIQEEIIRPAQINAEGEICWYIKEMLQVDYNGSTYYRINEAGNFARLCPIELGSRFYDCDGTLLGGTGIYPRCEDFAFCDQLNNAFQSGTIIWQSDLEMDNNENEQDKIFEDFPWLTDLIDPNNCSAGTIEIYGGNAQHPYNYLLVTNADGAKLYNTNGAVYCTQTNNDDCISVYVNAYDISGIPFRTWTCAQNNCFCPQVVIPVCGVDGNTYNNDCEAACAGVDIAFDGPCNIDPPSQCSVTISNTQCRRIGVYDTNDRLLTTINQGPFGNSPFGTPTPTWTDPTPLLENEQRTYIFKEGNFILTRTTATCNNKEITTSNPYTPGCNDGLSLGIYTNTGCRVMSIVNTRSEVLGFLEPGESETLTATNYIYIFLVGNDTIDIKSDVGGTIDSGGCNNNGSSCTITITNNECRVIGIYDENDNLLNRMPSGPHSFGPLDQAASVWEDTRPLEIGATRTYIFKENNLIIGRQTATCNNTNITVVNKYFSGCTDALGIANIKNIGCRTLGIYATDGTSLHQIAPQDSVYLSTGIKIYVFLADQDSLTVASGNLTDANIDTGGCGESNNEIFNDYSWLSTIVNSNDCSNEKVAVYQSGVYSYLLVTNAAGVATLYNQDGQFYCQNSVNYDCLVAYNLTEKVAQWTCESNTASECSVTIFNGECRFLRIYDENDVLLTIDESRPSSVRPNEVWRDTRPLSGGESRTYIFKDGILELGRQIVTCANPNIALVNRFDDGCSETTFVPSELTNVGCSLLRVFNSGGGLVGRAFPGENLVLENVSQYYILMVDQDTIGVEFNISTRDIDTGGCPDRTNYNSVQIFEDYPWLTGIVDRNACSTKRVEVWQARTGIFLWVEDENGNGILYTENGQVQCQTTPTSSFNCFQAYELKELIAIWVCGSMDNSDNNEGNVEIFNDYTWLSTLVNLTNCSTEKVAVYQSGVYSYLLVTNAAGVATLYNQDGQFYCENSGNYDCVAAYNLGSPIATWSCGGTSPIQPSGACNLFSNIPSGTDLCEACYQDISVYEFRGENYVVYRAQTPDCRALELQVVNCTTNIGYCVTGPNLGFNPNCPIFWSEAIFVENLWTDADCANSSEEDCAEGSIAYEGTVIENECGTYILTTDNQYLTTNYTLHGIGTSIPVGTTISFNFINTATGDDFCLNREYGGVNRFGEISCLKVISEPSTCQNTGTIFFENCDDGRLFYFVEMEDGRVVDPYFDESITFNPIDGQRIKFDFVDANFSSPCSIAEKAIIITCVEEIEGNNNENIGTVGEVNFSEFSWLSDIVNPTTCNGETISVYQLGSFKYVYIESATGNSLYFQDGTFYCTDAPNYNCRNVYGLGEAVATWNCANLLPESKERRGDPTLETSFFTIFPNPTTDRFTIQVPEVSDKDYQVQVIDMLGRIVHQSTLPAKTTATTIDLADYQNGIYYVELRAAGIRSVKKVVKQGLE